MVSSIKGAGNTKVLVTLENTEETVYATEEKKNKEATEDKTDGQLSKKGRVTIVKKIHNHQGRRRNRAGLVGNANSADSKGRGGGLRRWRYSGSAATSYRSDKNCIKYYIKKSLRYKVKF